MREGDRVTSIDGEPVNTFSDLQRIVAGRAGERVDIEVERRGERLVLDVTIGARERDGQAVGFLGVGVGQGVSDYWYVRKFGPLASVGQSIERTWTSTGFTLRMLGRMVTGDVERL